ncbi:SDR family NAD(P)-dependent oxidoreductase [Catalinimonas niigatensis]|uniref:SDR family NAD(P)-dependent oxidoreductase n=1 Tax=Catalinimonas niigatensis TaxID=1397264 RepID=UPI002665E3CD|nr:SDR family NAD(P)-dependent oxidoreductase [Catalinimonas niigatensis]WPP51565.1 SDR family NAD(P)-dependent oxidoreductase [Catalinimonas niigatensis]
MANSKVLTIIGMGEGISMALAQKFGQQDFTIAMISRSDAKLKQYQKQLHQDGIEAYYYLADVANSQELKESLLYIHESLGSIDVLVYNAAAVRKVDLMRIEEQDLMMDFKVNTLGALTATQAVVREMESQGGGKIFFTGGGLSTHPNPQYGSLAIGKAGLRNLTYSLYQQLKPLNIHVATVTVNGFVQASDEKYNPEAIAAQFWNLYEQTAEDAEPEISY